MSLDKHIIQAALPQDPPIKFSVFESINSSNDYLLQYSEENDAIHVCLANHQTQARGRFHRKWYAPAHQNIYLSMRYVFHMPAQSLLGLQVVTAVSLCDAITDMTGLSNLQLKWPNDVLIDHQKLAGVLIEIKKTNLHHSDVIIGIGLNVNMDETNTPNMEQPWTSLKKISKKTYDRNALCIQLIKALITNFTRFETRGIKPFLATWQAKDVLLGKTISCMQGKKRLQGICQGINDQGELILQASKEIYCFSSTEVTLHV